MGAVTYPTLEHVAMEARPYPVDVLADAETGLVLFAAAFQGHNDAIHFAKAGIRTVCVDTDGERLEQMAELYPADWEFLTLDAFWFADHARRHGRTWDVVSLDPFTGDAMARVRAELELWTAIAERAVIVGVEHGVPEALIPLGWQARGYVLRSEHAEWLTLERSS